jgi:hypothetical protein
MKRILFLLLLAGVFVFSSCNKDDDKSARFKFLTAVTWETDELLVDGEDASGEGQFLENFKGDVKFNSDGTGTFGQYEGTWGLQNKDTELVIYSQEIGFPLTTIIEELTAARLRIVTSFPNFLNPQENLEIKMSFNAK